MLKTMQHRRQLRFAGRVSRTDAMTQCGKLLGGGTRDAQRFQVPQLPRRVPAKTDRTSSWQFGRLLGQLRAPGALSYRGEPRVEVEPHAGPSAV